MKSCTRDLFWIMVAVAAFFGGRHGAIDEVDDIKLQATKDMSEVRTEVIAFLNSPNQCWSERTWPSMSFGLYEPAEARLLRAVGAATRQDERSMPKEERMLKPLQGDQAELKKRLESAISTLNKNDPR